MLDDSSGGATPATSSGEITSPGNGSALSDSAALTLAATTSPELMAVAFGFDASADSGDDGDGLNGDDDVDQDGVFADPTPNSTTATARTWPASVSAAASPNDDEAALTLFSTNGDMDAGVPV